MTTIEKLFVQIFERKKLIIEQVKHQTDLLDQHLASKCLLDGIPPPPWLWSPSFPSLSSRPNELNKEELISGLLLPRPQPANPYFSSQCSLNPAVTADDGGLTNGLYTEVHALNKNIGAGDRLSVLPQFPISDVQCTLNEAPELDVSVTSPQDCGDVRISDNVPDHTQSLARIQRSKSRQRALELRNSAKATKTCSCDENNSGACTSRMIGSGITSLQYNHVDESELVKPIEASNKRWVEEAKINECRGKENCNDISYGRITRSGSSSQQPSFLNEPRNVGNSSYIAKDNGLAKSINTLTEQPHHVNELSKLVNTSFVIGDASCMSEKANIDDCRDNEMGIFSDGSARPRNSSRKPSSAKESLDMDNCSYIPKEDCRLRESIDESAQQPNYVNEILELVKPSSLISNESCGEGKAKIRNSQSKEKGSNIYLGRITRSRSSSQQPDHVNGCLKLDNSCGDSKEEAKRQLNHVDDLRELVKPCDVTDNICGVKGKMSVCQDNEGRSESYSARVTRSRSSIQQFNNVNGFPKVGNLSAIANDDDSDCAQSFGKSLQPPQPLSLVGGEGIDLQEVLGIQADVLPCAESNNIANLERRDAIVAEAETDSDELVEAFSVTFGSNLQGASLGVEVSVSSPPAECAMLVKPKQLDFDELEDCILNETPCPALQNEPGGASSEKQPSTLLHSADMLHKVVSVNYQEKHNSSTGMPSLEELDFSGKGEKPWNDSSEAHMKDRDGMIDENIINSVQKKANFAISQTQDEDSYFMGSWPQHKRTKIGGQITNVLSASPRLMTKQFQPVCTQDVSRNINAVEDNPNIIHKSERFYVSHVGDDMQSNVDKGPIEDMHQNMENHIAEGPQFSSPNLQAEEVQLSLDGMDRSANNTLMHEQPGAPSVSSLTKPATGVSQGCLLEKAEVAEPDTREQHTAGENQFLLQLEDRFDLGSSEILMYTEKSIQGKKSHLGSTENLSYCSVGSPQRQSLNLIDADQNKPELEGFIMETDNEQPCIAGEGINFDRLDLPDGAIERASVLERLCKSACLQTPLSHFSTTYELHKTLNLYQSIPTGLLESMEPRSTLNAIADTGKQLGTSSSCLNGEVNSAFHGRLHSDCLPFSNAQSTWDIRKPYLSPVGKLWDGITSKSGSSEKQASSMPDLPCISEENENTDELADTFQDGIGSEVMTSPVKREPLADITETSIPMTSVYEAEIFGDRCSLASVNTEFSITGTCKRAKLKLRNQNSNKRRYVSKEKENQSISLGVNGVKKANESLPNRFSKPKFSGKTSLRKGGPSLSERESKRNNIVSNVTSFIPLVQQKQAAAVITGKREIKVKALEAAEAVKRLAEKKENERKTRKEALKIERARMEEQNLRQLELEKERKEEERKRKEADMAAKKRQREEESRKERERKRKRVEEARRQQLEKEEKLRAEKEVKQKKYRAADERAYERKESKENSGKHEEMEKAKGDNNIVKVPETEPKTTRVSTIDTRKASNASEGCDALSDCGDNSKVTRDFCKETESYNLVSNISQEQSYEISPYKSSDDEAEDDDDYDDIPNSKFIPSWASKSHLVLVVSSQQRKDPESIFSPESFSNIAEESFSRNNR